MSQTTTSDERLPPYSQDAERSVLGSMLRDNERIAEAVQYVNPHSFYTDAHQKICFGIFALWERHVPVDLVTIAEYLRERGYVEDIGGYAYLAELWDSAPCSANCVHYARIVRDRSLCRGLIHTCNDIVKEAYDPWRESDQMVAAAEEAILHVAGREASGQTVKLSKAMSETLTSLDRRMSRGRTGQSLDMLTGWDEYDEKTAGLHAGELTIIAARPSVGKTALAINMLSKFSVDRKMPAFFASLEQSRIEISERLLSMHSGVACHAIRKGRLNNDDVRNIQIANERLHDAPLTIDDTPMQSMMKIGAAARRLHHRERIRLVVVDYLQLIEPENRRENRNNQIGDISRRLKCLARELEVPVVCLCQLSREAAKEKPRLHHLRDSGNIEQDADTVLLLHRPEESRGVVEVDIAKQRNGPTGEVSLSFNTQLMRFDTFAPELGL